MSLNHMRDPEAVRRAMAEFDAMGRETFPGEKMSSGLRATTSW